MANPPKYLVKSACNLYNYDIKAGSAERIYVLTLRTHLSGRKIDNILTNFRSEKAGLCGRPAGKIGPIGSFLPRPAGVQSVPAWGQCKFQNILNAAALQNGSTGAELDKGIVRLGVLLQISGSSSQVRGGG